MKVTGLGVKQGGSQELVRCRNSTAPALNCCQGYWLCMRARRSRGRLPCDSWRDPTAPAHTVSRRLPPTVARTHLGHAHLGVAAAVDDARVRNRLAQHAQRVVQAALRLVQHVRA